MNFSLIQKGMVIGFSVAAPVGPIGVLVIRRSIANGRAAGLVSGLGAATADAIYGAVAALGISVISTALLVQRSLLQGVGGAFLCYLGAKTFFAAPATNPAKAKDSRGLWSAYASTFFLTITNPMTILSFMAVFAGFGLAAAGRYNAASGLVLVTAVFVGSGIWWLILSTGAGALRRFIGTNALRWINRISGCIIVAFGVFALVALFRG